MLKLKIYIAALLAALALCMSSCIEDGFTTSPSDGPDFSTDVVDLGLVFTEQVTPTTKLMVYNRHAKGLNISDIRLEGPNAEYFRINVDGINGRTFSDVEIRAKDSIYVLIEAKLPPNGANGAHQIATDLVFTTNGVRSSVQLTASGLDVHRINAQTLEIDTHFTAEKPYVVFDSLVVAPGATLRIDPGTQMLFHDKAMMIVRGRLISEGTTSEPIVFSGDRMGKLVGDFDFDIMSRQWIGMFFTPTSFGNRMANTVVKNTVQGVTVEGFGAEGVDNPMLTMVNCVLRNSAYNALESYHAAIKAIGCEFAEAGDGLVYMQGGAALFNHCTFANNYLYAVISSPALNFAHVGDDPESGLDDGSGLPYVSAEISNSIISGYGGAVSHSDLADTGIFFRSCLINIEGEDDDHFISTIWDQDPLFFTVRNEYFFDYRLKNDSPAIGAADPTMMLPEAALDIHGKQRVADALDLGAYVFDPDFQPLTE